MRNTGAKLLNFNAGELDTASQQVMVRSAGDAFPLFSPRLFRRWKKVDNAGNSTSRVRGAAHFSPNAPNHVCIILGLGLGVERRAFALFARCGCVIRLF